MTEDVTDLNSSGAESTPLVSILVPSYNHEPYIIECLESIRRLNYPRLELLVSDDCSKDGTFVLAETWAERNATRFEQVRIVRQGANIGLVPNLQYLFDHALGTYLAYIASDDLFLETALTERVRILECEPDIDGIFGNAQAIAVNGAVLAQEYIPRRLQRELASSTLMISSLLLQFRLPGPVMMLRKRAVLEGGSLGKLPADIFSDDIYIYTRLASLKRLRFFNKPVAKYRIAVPGGMNCTYSNVHLQQFVKAYEKNMHLLRGFDRFVLNCRLARYKAEIEKDGTPHYSVKVFALRSLLLVLRAALFTSALAIAAVNGHGQKS